MTHLERGIERLEAAIEAARADGNAQREQRLRLQHVGYCHALACLQMDERVGSAQADKVEA